MTSEKKRSAVKFLILEKAKEQGFRRDSLAVDREAFRKRSRDFQECEM